MIHEINKVSNYWRISCTLTQLCRCLEYRALFAEPILATLQHYEPDIRGSISRYVHAEIQLIVHYEFWPTKCLPRIIGASKQGCYLCYAFVKAHKQFHLLKSHRQIYNQWTVPDCKEYTLETVKRFQRALSTVNQEVLDEIRKTRTSPKGFRPFPLQSLINLRMPDFPDGSDTTAKSARTSEASLVSRQFQKADTKSQHSKMPSLSSLDDLQRKEQYTGVGRSNQNSDTDVWRCQNVELTGSQIGRPYQATYINTSVSTTKQTSIATDPSSGPRGLIFDWLDLHVYPSPAAGYTRMDIKLARCETNETTQNDGKNIIDINSWPLGQKITIPINKADPELDIMFVNGLGRIRMLATLEVDQ